MLYMDFQEWQRRKAAEENVAINQAADQHLAEQRLAERSAALERAAEHRYLQERQGPAHFDRQLSWMNYIGVIVFGVTIIMLLIGLVIVRFVFLGDGSI